MRAVPAAPARPTLIFATGTGRQPWESDPALAAPLIAEDDLAFIRALEASNRKPVEKQPEIIEVKGASEPEGETLEVVRPEPPEDPSAYR